MMSILEFFSSRFKDEAFLKWRR